MTTNSQEEFLIGLTSEVTDSNEYLDPVDTPIDAAESEEVATGIESTKDEIESTSSILDNAPYVVVPEVVIEAQQEMGKLANRMFRPPTKIKPKIAKALQEGAREDVKKAYFNSPTAKAIAAQDLWESIPRSFDDTNPTGVLDIGTGGGVMYFTGSEGLKIMGSDSNPYAQEVFEQMNPVSSIPYACIDAIKNGGQIKEFIKQAGIDVLSARALFTALDDKRLAQFINTVAQSDAKMLVHTYDSGGEFWGRGISNRIRRSENDRNFEAYSEDPVKDFLLRVWKRVLSDNLCSDIIRHKIRERLVGDGPDQFTEYHFIQSAAVPVARVASTFEQHEAQPFENVMTSTPDTFTRFSYDQDIPEGQVDEFSTSFVTVLVRNSSGMDYDLPQNSSPVNPGEMAINQLDVDMLSCSGAELVKAIPSFAKQELAQLKSKDKATYQKVMEINDSNHNSLAAWRPSEEDLDRVLDDLHAIFTTSINGR